ncbi:hypothetical protein [Phenylobacterium zucineum]|uniref:hypothetical protein n=1 Tax=Phenylobacterium zucineum TaxID=284016 RepID=UPI00059DDCE5|nr:hypothetical protein [Phenylobacterium zucineum]
MRLTFAAAAVAAALASPADAQTDPLPPRSELYTIEYLVGPDGRLLHVLKGIDDKQQCENIDTGSISTRNIGANGARLVSDALVVSPQGTFNYYLWIVEKSGIHTVFRAGYIVRNCSLTETRSQQSYYSGDNRYRQAASAYNALLRTGLAAP